MYITCLDVEGVLVPEIWVAFAEESGIPELKRTTRDEPDYDKLMLSLIHIQMCIRDRFKIVQDLVDRLNLVSREILTGLPVIRAFSTETVSYTHLDVYKRQRYTGVVIIHSRG